MPTSVASSSFTAALLAMSDRTHEDYTVGWICPLDIEQIPAVRMLDQIHPRLEQSPTDYNIYTLGSIAGYDVVIAGLHQTGNNPAASVVTQMRNIFPNVRFVLVVGIGGGVPVETGSGRIQLGDVVVAKPAGVYPGVVQYDRGKAEVGQFVRRGALPPPPAILLNAVRDLAVHRALLNTGRDPIARSLSRLNNDPTLRFRFPGSENDQLYSSDYIDCLSGASCIEGGCDPGKRIHRDANEEYVRVHRGV